MRVQDKDDSYRMGWEKAFRKVLEIGREIRRGSVHPEEMGMAIGAAKFFRFIKSHAVLPVPPDDVRVQDNRLCIVWEDGSSCTLIAFKSAGNAIKVFHVNGIVTTEILSDVSGHGDFRTKGGEKWG